VTIETCFTQQDNQDVLT